MNIGTIAYHISQNDFFNDNFDIDLEESFDGKFAIISKHDMFFDCGKIYIYVSIFDDSQVLVKFANDNKNSMKCIYAVNEFDVNGFVNWLMNRLSEFAWQVLKFSTER